jgi:LuxR family maltose regulon positive regulatory protein
MDTHPDPDQFVKELITDDSAVTGYLVEEILNPQPPAVRDVLLSTSILECVNAQAATELTGNEQAGTILSALARANAFVQPTGSGWYRYHPLFAEVLRLELKREHPDRMACVHRRAARWYERNGQLTFAVRHAAAAGDWQLAASMVIDGLAISEIIQSRGSPSLASEFGGMPHDRAWAGPQPHLVRRLLAPGPCHDQLSTLRSDPDQAPILMVKTLTERELEVLRLASGLLSNAELASKMYITVNTVKTHLKHIYRKLETTRRAEAIRRARQLELI